MLGKFSFVFLLALLLACRMDTTVGAQQPEVATVVYKQLSNLPLHLDVCPPKDQATGKQQAWPVALVVHGGGWGSGDRKTMIPDVLASFVSAGIGYVSIDYRLSPAYQWPACREDTLDAVAWTKSNIAHYGGDPDRIAILGYSAGGQLAFWAAIKDQSPHPLKGLVGIAPATDFLEDLGRRSGPSKALQDLMGVTAEDTTGDTLVRLHQASPINHLHAKLPPMLLMHGDDDRSVPIQQSLHIQQKIAEKKWPVACELYKVPGAGHRQSDWKKYDARYLPHLIAWLQARFSE